MNLVKAKIVGGACEGATMWVDKDSSLTHWNQGTWITTYKTYDFYNGKKNKEDISGRDYHARIKEEFIEFIEEEKETAVASSMFNDLVSAYGDQEIFSVITAEGGEMMKGDITFEQCEEWIKKRHDECDCDFEIIMKIMETKTTKQMKPTI